MDNGKLSDEDIEHFAHSELWHPDDPQRKMALEIIELRRACDVVRSGEREWINANNRLPEKDSGRFLVFNGAVVFEMSYNIQFGGWHTPSGTTYKGVTHWMPLPEPPASN